MIIWTYYSIKLLIESFLDTNVWFSIMLAVWLFIVNLFSDEMDQDAMQDGGLDEMMENELANMAERDAEVEMVMAEFDAGKFLLIFEKMNCKISKR